MARTREEQEQKEKAERDRVAAAAAGRRDDPQGSQLDKEAESRGVTLGGGGGGGGDDGGGGGGFDFGIDSGGTDFSGNDLGVDFIPAQFELWMIAGQLHMVYFQPTLGGETIPLAYSVTAEQLRNHYGSDYPTNAVETWDQASFDSLGGLAVGTFVELNNPDSDPFDTWLTEMAEQATIFPWLMDPEIMAITAAAWLEGRSASLAELASTEWWRTHAQSERDWMVLSNSDPSQAFDRMQDNRILMNEMFSQAGIANPPGALIDLIADQFTTGLWTEVYAQNQIALMADPFKQGTLDPLLENFNSGDLDSNTTRRDRVKELVRRWLGPMHGDWDDDLLDQWGGRLRNDPEGETALTELLSRHRLALFPEYQDGSLTYEDIASPWRGLVGSVWGQQPDETDGFFNQIVRSNDAQTATQMLREEGLKRQIGKVGLDATADLMQSFGGNVIRVQ